MSHMSYDYDHKKGGKLPRKHVWRAYRFCVQDAILGVTVVRHDRRLNRLEVDVFLTSDIPEYDSGSGCRALALLVLSDAYSAGGSMEIRFTPEVAGGAVPEELRGLAKSHHIRLFEATPGVVDSTEAKDLYLALSGFSDEVRTLVIALDRAGRLSAASVCYGMHHGIWGKEEIEIILSCSETPETILKDSHPQEAWHLFHGDLLLARNALMGSYLDRRLRTREHGVADSVVELEDDEIPVEIGFEAGLLAKRYVLPEGSTDRIAVPWVSGDGPRGVLEPGRPVWVLLRGRDAGELRARLPDDIRVASAWSRARGGAPVHILVPADGRDAVASAQIQAIAAKDGVGLLVCPEFTNQLDAQVCRRFESVRIIRD